MIRVIQCAIAASATIALIGTMALADSMLRVYDDATVKPLASFRVCLVVVDGAGNEYIAGVGDDAQQAMRGAELPDYWTSIVWYNCEHYVSRK